MKLGKYFRITNYIHAEMKEEFRSLSVSTKNTEKEITDRIEGYIDVLSMVDGHMSKHFDDYTTITDAKKLLSDLESMSKGKPDGYADAIRLSVDIVDEVLLGWENDSKDSKTEIKGR